MEKCRAVCDLVPPAQAGISPALRGPGRSPQMLEIVLLVVLVLLLLGALPTWPYSRSWGYYPSGGFGVVLVIILILLLLGYI